MAMSMSSSEWAADICVRMRARSAGTTGNEKAMTKTPSASRRSAISTATRASPSMTGMIGWPAPVSVNPAAAMPARNRCEFRSS